MITAQILHESNYLNDKYYSPDDYTQAAHHLNLLGITMADLDALFLHGNRTLEDKILSCFN